MNFKLTKNKIALGVVSLAIAGGLVYSLTSEQDHSKVMVCESTTSYNKGIGLTFYLDKDGETIEKIEKSDKVSLDFIKNNLTTENTEQILEEYKENVKFLYDDTVETYKDVKWFSADLKEDDDYIQTIYTFDVSDEDFNYEKYKSLLSEFSLDYYYDSTAGKFVYNEEKFLSDSTPLGNIESVACTEQGTETTVTVVNEDGSKKEVKSGNSLDEKAKEEKSSEKK